MKKPKLVVTGYARHGKDTVCQLLKEEHGFTFESSSQAAGFKAVYPTLRLKYKYKTFEDCYNDRVNHRQEWFELIKAYNTPDLAKLGREILHSYDIYCGLRNMAELETMIVEGLVDCIVWVDAGLRKKPEPSTSITITRNDCDFVVDNNGTLDDLRVEVQRLVEKLI
jgi:dephospho-CoA kinase